MSIDEELKFNILHKMSFAYNKDDDNTGILNNADLLTNLSEPQKQELCGIYCYNYADNDLCKYCDNKYKTKNMKEEPLYANQFGGLLKQPEMVDSIQYTPDSLTPYTNLTNIPKKTVQRNGKTYELHVPYIVIKGEKTV